MPRILLPKNAARERLVAYLELARPRFPSGAQGVRELLKKLRCIQLDPLDALGTNADLVVMARVDGICRGQIYEALFPGHAFEHFAKERCLLPQTAFPWYRQRATETPWWRLSERLKRLKPHVIERVLEEVRQRGPLTVRELTDHGKVKPIDWSGWKGTKRASVMALEVLWTRCQVVVCGRRGRHKLYDIPERALPIAKIPASPGEFERWALLDRAHACGLLAKAGGPQWSTLTAARRSGLPQKLIEDGLLEEIQIEETRQVYLAPKGFHQQAPSSYDDRMRLLGPLDPLLWDRKLVRTLFGFEYVWEVYKPQSQRRWGWYVCPLLYRGHLVGRLEGRVEKECLVILRYWPEKHFPPLRVFYEMLERHAEACGAKTFKLAKKAPQGP